MALPGRLCIFICLLLLTLNVNAQLTIPESLLYQQWDKGMLEFNTQPWTEGCDSIYYAVHGKTYYYNIDSICHLLVTREFSEIAEEMWYFYFIVDVCGPERRVTDIEKLQKINKRYKSKALEKELDVYNLYKIFYIPITSEIWDYAWHLVEKYERQGDLQTKLRIMQRMLFACSGYPTNLVSERVEKDRLPVIKLINEILSTLERLDGEPYIFEPGYFYRHIGLIYYNFQYYNKAVPLLWKAVEQPTGHYYNRNIMIARDYLGDYYSMTGDYDRSDSLYLSILKSPDAVFLRPVYDVVAIGAIAANTSFRGNNDEAIRLYSIALPRAFQVRDSTLAAGYALHLGRLFMERGELERTRDLLDQAYTALIAGGLPIRNWERYYTLARDYYLKTNRADRVEAYIDSISMIRKEERNIYNTQILAYAEQEAFEIEQVLKDEQLQTQRMRLLLVTVILILSLLLSGLLFYFYRKIQKKNRDLYLRIKEQDSAAARQEEILQSYSSETAPLPGDVRHHKLFIRLRDYLMLDMNFAKAELDAELLISELSTNRAYLFEAVKFVTGKTLQEYINTLRLEEGKRLLETSDETIESIAMICGYNSVRTFYRLFRSHYNISPAVYRKMGKEQNRQN